MDLKTISRNNIQLSYHMCLLCMSDTHTIYNEVRAANISLFYFYHESLPDMLKLVWKKISTSLKSFSC